MHKLSLKITIQDQIERASALQNLLIEASESRTKRANFSAKEVDIQIIVEIEAKDLVMLRAFSNSVFRILKTSLEVTNIFNKPN